MGFASERELLSRLSSKEVTDWQAFSAIEPFGEEREDIRAAMVACTVANALRSSKSPPCKIKDFMLNFEPPKQQSKQDMKAILMGVGNG